jgi:hypothetical protein
MALDVRTELFNLRMSVDEMAMLRALADSMGLSAADVVRQSVRRAYAEKFGDKPPKRTKRK